MSTYTPTEVDLARARRILDNPNGDSPAYVLGLLESTLGMSGAEVSAELMVREARAVIMVYKERR